MAVLAYLLLIRACHQEILPGTSWSIAQLQHAFRLRIITKANLLAKIASHGLPP